MSTISKTSKVAIPTPLPKAESKLPRLVIEEGSFEPVLVELKGLAAGTVLVPGRADSIRKGGKKKKDGSTSSKMALPPVLHATPIVRNEKKRFLVSSGGAYGVSLLEVVGSLGGFCTTANSTVSHWCSSFRIHRITLWPDANSTGSMNGVEWAVSLSAFLPDQYDVVTIPGGTTAPMALSYRPPAKSLCGDWINIGGGLASSATLFNLTNVGAGCFIDVDVTWTLGVVVSSSASLLTSTVSSGTLGAIYYLALDGPSSNKVLPITGIPTTH